MSDLELKDGQEKNPAALLWPRRGPVSGPTLIVLSGVMRQPARGALACPLPCQPQSAHHQRLLDSSQSCWAAGEHEEAQRGGSLPCWPGSAGILFNIFKVNKIMTLRWNEVYHSA